MDLLWKDIRFSIHSLRANPGFALVAILTLALGIGATTAIFSVVNGVLLQPLPLHDPERLVMAAELRLNEAGAEPNNVSPANYMEWRRQAARVFSSMGATFNWEVSLTGSGEPELVRGAFADGTLFSTLGAKPYLGRTIRESEESSVVLSHRLWQRKFGADPKAIGKTVRVDDEPLTIVGVMRPDFVVPKSRADLWVPFAPKPTARGRYLNIVARLAPGISIDRAEAEMKVIAQRLSAAHPRFNTNWSAVVTPLHEVVVGNVRRTLVVVLAAVALLLLIGCVNIANLLLSRATARAKEMAIRSALGASRGQLIRQLLTESVLLAAIAGVVGVVLAGWATLLLIRFTPESVAMPRMAEVAIDGRVLLVSAVITLATGVFFGLAPALRVSRTDLQSGLKSSSRGATHDRAGKMFRNVLVVAEVALSTVLLIGAGLLIKSFAALEGVRSGVRADNVLTMRVVLPSAYDNPERRQAVVTRMLDVVRAVPGVERVGAATSMPFTDSLANQNFRIEGEAPPRADEDDGANIRPIAGDYFHSMGIPILAGRPFDANAMKPATAPPGEGAPMRTEVVVNDAFVQRYLKGRNAVGRIVLLEWFADYRAEIVGVAGSVRAAGLAKEAAPAIYLSYVNDPNTQFTLTIESKSDPRALQVPVTKVLRGIDPLMPISDVATLDTLVSSTIARPRFNATMLTIFAALGLLLASIGIYGVLSYSVAQRTQEMGIRMALGAEPGSVLRLVVRDGMGLALVGIAAGVIGALPATRLLDALLYGVKATDPAVFVSVAGTLAAVALIASYIPARRATRVDPMVALRPE